MVYFRLNSKYEGDVTKNCGLSIDEVDGNFYELEVKINSLIDELTEKFDVISDKLNEIEGDVRDIKVKTMLISRTVHDAEICPPGTSNDANYILDEIDKHKMYIGGEIDFDSIHGGNRFGVSIQPVFETSEEKYPNATWFINDIEVGNFWEEIKTNPENWPTALYLYPKVEKLTEGVCVSLAGVTSCDNTLSIKINWNENLTETYNYIVDNDVILKPENV